MKDLQGRMCNLFMKFTQKRLHNSTWNYFILQNLQNLQNMYVHVYVRTMEHRYESQIALFFVQHKYFAVLFRLLFSDIM